MNGFGKVNFTSPSAFRGPGRWRTETSSGLGAHHLHVPAGQVAGVAADRGQDLGLQDVRGDVPVRAEDHLVHLLGENRRLAVAGSGDDAHGERFAPVLVGVELEGRHVDEDGAPARLPSLPPPALEVQLDLEDAVLDGNVEGVDGLAIDEPGDASPWRCWNPFRVSPGPAVAPAAPPVGGPRAGLRRPRGNHRPSADSGDAPVAHQRVHQGGVLRMSRAHGLENADRGIAKYRLVQQRGGIDGPRAHPPERGRAAGVHRPDRKVGGVAQERIGDGDVRGGGRARPRVVSLSGQTLLARAAAMARSSAWAPGVRLAFANPRRLVAPARVEGLEDLPQLRAPFVGGELRRALRL